MKYIILFFILVLLTGCASSPIDFSDINPFGGSKNEDTGEVVPANPIQAAGNQLNRYGVILTAGGILFAVITKGRTGWGWSTAGAGVIMIMLAWAFDQWWVPYLGLITILGYVGYKIWNWGSNKVETEHPLL